MKIIMKWIILLEKIRFVIIFIQILCNFQISIFLNLPPAAARYPHRVSNKAQKIRDHDQTRQNLNETRFSRGTEN